MLTKEYKALKSGTDIRGVASGDGKINLTTEVAKKVAASFIQFIKNKTRKENIKIAIGRDSRVSGPALVKAASEGARQMGADVLICSIATTPSMFFATYYEGSDCDGAIEITASHLPQERNGLKFFIKEGGLSGDDIIEILQMTQDGVKLSEKMGTESEFDLMSPYAQSLVDLVRDKTGKEKPFEGKKIVIDAGNGAGGFFASKVLEPLGANTEGSIFLEPDGTFPNHIPNPENATAMEFTAKAVIESGADAGICFDTDCDRAAIVDKGGYEINRNRLIALISAILLEEEKGITVVTDSVTSDGLTEFIKAKGGTHHRFMRGYKKVIDEAKRLEGEGICAPIAIETSGHGALKENRYLDDGSYLSTRLLIKLALTGKTFKEMIADLKEPVESKEIRVNIKAENFSEYGKKVLSDLEAKAHEMGLKIANPSYEGVRINFDKDNGDGWILVRMSLHDPVIPINIETNSNNSIQKIVDFIYNFLKNYDMLDLSAF